ncbi:MAG: AMP-binding protein [Acidobacteria bacterium]|nr:AMP-binding protein [Acidobacteriota bacterium]
MNFLETIFTRLRAASRSPVLREARDGQLTAVTGGEFLALVTAARGFLRERGVQKGERCAILAANSIRWAAMELAIMAEGGIVVPLYSRQAMQELVRMLKDSSASLICCGDQTLRETLNSSWPEASASFLFDEIFRDIANGETEFPPPLPLSDEQTIAIIYTSGTSGEPKGVMLTAGNFNFILGATAARLDLLTEHGATERVFHYLPFCFAASTIGLLTFLSRDSIVTISTDLTKLGDEMKLAAPDYFMNVPALLERVRASVENQFNKWGGIRQTIFQRGREAWLRQRDGHSGLTDSIWLGLASALFFAAIRRKIAPNLKALICGSAPLSVETQLFFFMLGIPVLQVYGLTETTAICTMDDPHDAEPGRVGPAIDGIEMKLGANDEILVRGPNIFAGYWNRPQATQDALRDSWFHTGDQGEVNRTGKWRITGRIKNLIVLASGHNVAPEPIEELLARKIPGAQHAFVVGNARPFLSVVLTGDINCDVHAVIEEINSQLPHYRRIRAFHLHKEPFTVGDGMLTANGKLKRDVITEWLASEIEQMYQSAESRDPGVGGRASAVKPA